MGEPQTGSTNEASGEPWGFWPTLGFGLLIFALWTLVQGVTGLMLKGADIKAGHTGITGWRMAWATIAGAPVAVGASIFLARRRKGISVSTYLGLVLPSRKQALHWSLIALGYIAVGDALSWALGRPIVPESMLFLYSTARSLPILCVALAVAAPLAEEFLFRGFLLRGFASSRLGPVGAIALSALVFAIIHVQYDWYVMILVAGVGAILGFARWRTGSLWLCVLLHALNNAVALVQVMLT